MAKLLMGQINHATDRVRQLAREKLGDAPRKPEELGWSDVQRRLLDGENLLSPTVIQAALVKLREAKKKANYYSSPDFRNCVAEVLYEKENARALEKYETEREIHQTRVAAVAKEEARVKDIIVLGDSERILRAIEEFAKFTV